MNTCRACPLIWLLTLSVVWVLHGEESRTEPADFIRYVESEAREALQTAVVRYERADGVRVTLAGAVHIADGAYFSALNERFKKHDAVLYEMVGGPYSKRQENPGAGGAQKLQWVGQLQELMRKALELEGQLECIHYDAPNFIHADMSTEGFFASQEQKQESFFSLWVKALKAQSAAGGSQQRQLGLVQLLRILMSRDGATEMKRLIGREFDSVEHLLAGVESDGGTTLIGERNRHALAIMDREIQSGKKDLAIFYGAAHLPDMEVRLLERGFKRVEIEYLDAWQIRG